MADKVVLEAEIKSNIKAVSKETKDLTNNFGAFGITIGSIKEKFNDLGKIMSNGLTQIKLQAQLAGVGFKQMFSGQIIAGAKNLFKVIKVGVASTGVGALVIAFTSLVTFLTKTKKGAELLEVAFAGIGAAVNVIVDRVSKFGGAIVKLFQRDTKGALEDLKGAFSDIGTEIAEDTRKTMELKRTFQLLRDSQRELNVETAEQRAEIERLKLIAEDVTKSTKVRLEAAKEAFKKENNLLNRRIANAKEQLRLQREEMAVGENMAEDLDKEADLRINLANIKQESTTKQIELNNKLNAIQAEAEAKRLAALDAEIAANKERMGELTKMPRIANEVADELILADDKVMENYIANTKIRTLKTQEQIHAELDAYANLAGALSSLAGDNKELAIAETIISTYSGATKALALGAGTPVGWINAAAIIAAGLANVQRIVSTPIEGSSGGGGGGGGGGGLNPPTQTPAPQMMSGTFELGGGVAPEPVRAYVVTDEMTNSQNQLANIRRRATI